MERRWRASGSPADEAAWLRARVRAGRLDPWRLELAARCGHPALGGPESPPLALGEWLRALPFESPRQREWTRVPLAASSALEPVAARLGLGWLSGFLDHASALHLDPRSASEREALGAVLQGLFHELQPDLREPSSPAVAVVGLALLALRCLNGEGRSVEELERMARAALQPEGVWSVEPGVDQAIEATFPRAEGRLWGLRQAIARDLIGWALGADPLRARAARARS